MGLIALQQKTVPEIIVASKKVYIEDKKTIQKKLNAAYDDLYNYMITNRTCADYCKAMFCNISNKDLSYEYIEAVLLLRSLIEGSESIKIYKLSQTSVVSALHVGDFSTIGQTHIELTKWIKENHLVISGAYREYYYKYDLRNTMDTITEIQYPIMLKK
jgi:effector-binding domain-containing protein